jgi:hypothetical protein
MVHIEYIEVSQKEERKMESDINVDHIKIYHCFWKYFSMRWGVLRANTTQQNASCEVDTRSDNEDIPRLLWNQNVHYSAHKSPPPVSIVSHVTVVHILPLYFLKMPFNIILPPTVSFFELLTAFSFQTKIFCYQVFVVIAERDKITWNTDNFYCILC